VGEKVIVRQNSAFGTVFLYADPDGGEQAPVLPVAQIHELTPYGMLLASLGACTALVMHTYAQAHKVALEEVELQLTYERTYREDCKHCDDDKPFEEAIHQEILVAGKLSAGERKRLLRAAQLCPIHKMLHSGIAVSLVMAASDAPFTPLAHEDHVDE
jgi:uncharacterized OsmC-like protein